MAGEDGLGKDASNSGDRLGAGRRYRLTGLGLFGLGVLAGVAAYLAPTAGVREILVAFTGVGLFGAVLTYWIRPGATADADPAARVYAAHAATGAALARDLELADRHVYVPTDAADDGFTPVHLVVPREGAPPEVAARRPVFGVAGVETDGGEGNAVEQAPERDEIGTVRRERRQWPPDATGIALYPTGAALLDTYERRSVGELTDEPTALGEQLATGVVGGLELADAVDAVVEADEGTATVTVRAPRFGPVTRFDHPVSSFLAVGFAHALDVPVTVGTTETDEGAYRVTFEWPVDGTAA